jgi:TATA-box binding protein (TBP) (component of TFIID and TFIIIB)
MDITITPSDLTCHNVLAIAQVNVPLDLGRVVKLFKNAEYDEAKFNCVRTRMWKFRCTVAIFSSGKLQVTGASSPEDAHAALKFAAYRLKSIFPAVVFSAFKIDNLLATFDIGARMDLLGLSRDPSLTVTYMPQQFAGAVVREVLHQTGVVVDVFGSGKINIKGRGGMENVCKGVNLLMPSILKHLCEEL